MLVNSLVAVAFVRIVFVTVAVFTLPRFTGCSFALAAWLCFSTFVLCRWACIPWSSLQACYSVQRHEFRDKFYSRQDPVWSRNKYVWNPMRTRQKFSISFFIKWIPTLESSQSSGEKSFVSHYVCQTAGWDGGSDRQFDARAIWQILYSSRTSLFCASQFPIYLSRESRASPHAARSCGKV